jgi:hypothetical protein
MISICVINLKNHILSNDIATVNVLSTLLIDRWVSVDNLADLY